MPNSPSAIKRMRSDAKKQALNQAVISELRTLNKKLLQLEKDAGKATAYAKHVISCYDQAASKGAIPRGRADRKKSRIVKFLARIKK